ALLNVDGTPAGLELRDLRFQGIDHSYLSIKYGSYVSGTAQIDGTVMEIGASLGITFTTPSTFLADCRTTNNCFIRFESTEAGIPFGSGSRYLRTLLWVTTPEPEIAALLTVGLAFVGYARWRRC